jgi:hypothetical protein
MILSLFMLIVFCAVALQAYTLSTSKKEEPGVYAQIGRPTPFLSDGKNLVFVFTFILPLKHRRILEHRRLRLLCDVLFALLFISITLFGIVVGQQVG